jgi:hypothetical protein
MMGDAIKVGGKKHGLGSEFRCAAWPVMVSDVIKPPHPPLQTQHHFCHHSSKVASDETEGGGGGARGTHTSSTGVDPCYACIHGFTHNTQQRGEAHLSPASLTHPTAHTEQTRLQNLTTKCVPTLSRGRCDWKEKWDL